MLNLYFKRFQVSILVNDTFPSNSFRFTVRALYCFSVSFFFFFFNISCNHNCNVLSLILYFSFKSFCCRLFNILFDSSPTVSEILVLLILTSFSRKLMPSIKVLDNSNICSDKLSSLKPKINLSSLI